MPDLQQDIVALVREVCMVSEPDLSDLDRPLIECGLDSLDYVSVLMAAEDKYDLAAKDKSFTDGISERLLSVNDIVQTLREFGVS